MKFVPEFRQDLVSGDWILISIGRRQRPVSFKPKKRTKKLDSKKNCPFEEPQKSGNPFPVLWYPGPGAPLNKREDISSWFIQVFPNKYPALVSSKICSSAVSKGPYKVMKGMGLHEVIVFRDHKKTLGLMNPEELELVLRAYQERFIALKNEPCIEYVLVFHNQGELAGASLEHPHSQLIALPIIPPDVSRSLNGSAEFFKKHKKCVHCLVLDWERKEKTRLIYENKDFTVIAPFASRVSYEIRIFPKKHASDFSKMDEKVRPSLSLALKETFVRMNKVLKNPDYNFFIHTSPVEGPPTSSGGRRSGSSHYHWHIEILPRTYKWAGVELGTGIEIVAVSPEEVAVNLRKA